METMGLAELKISDLALKVTRLDLIKNTYGGPAWLSCFVDEGREARLIKSGQVPRREGDCISRRRRQKLELPDRWTRRRAMRRFVAAEKEDMSGFHFIMPQFETIYTYTVYMKGF